MGRFYLRYEKAILTGAVAVFFIGGYLGIALHTSGQDGATLSTSFDRALPYVPAAWPLYQSVYLLVLVPTRLFSRPAEMRAGAVANLTCMAISYAFFLLYPVHHPVPGASAAAADGVAQAGGNFAVWFDDRGMNCFPSLHMALATIASLCCMRADRRLGAAACALTALIAVSSLLLKRHYLIDLPAGMALGGVCYTIILRGRLGASPSLTLARSSPRGALSRNP